MRLVETRDRDNQVHTFTIEISDLEFVLARQNAYVRRVSYDLKSSKFISSRLKILAAIATVLEVEDKIKAMNNVSVSFNKEADHGGDVPKGKIINFIKKYLFNN